MTLILLDLSCLLPSDSDGIVKYVPKWFPGAEFQRLVAKWKTHTYNARDGPFNEAKDAYVSIPVLFSISLETQDARTNEKIVLDRRQAPDVVLIPPRFSRLYLCLFLDFYFDSRL